MFTNPLWPVYDPKLELEELVTVAIQVNGKFRGTVHVPHGIEEDQVRQEAENIDSVARFLRQGKLSKVIYVPGRTMNFVVQDLEK